MKILFAILVLILLAGCGNSTSGTSQPATIAPVTATPTVTRQVLQEATVEVTVVPTASATPEVQGFDSVNEQSQPCPAPYWKRRQCVATQQQIEDYASQGGK